VWVSVWDLCGFLCGQGALWGALGSASWSWRRARPRTGACRPPSGATQESSRQPRGAPPSSKRELLSARRSGSAQQSAAAPARRQRSPVPPNPSPPLPFFCHWHWHCHCHWHHHCHPNAAAPAAAPAGPHASARAGASAGASASGSLVGDRAGSGPGVLGPRQAAPHPLHTTEGGLRGWGPSDTLGGGGVSAPFRAHEAAGAGKGEHGARERRRVWAGRLQETRRQGWTGWGRWEALVAQRDEELREMHSNFVTLQELYQKEASPPSYWVRPAARRPPGMPS